MLRGIRILPAHSAFRRAKLLRYRCILYPYALYISFLPANKFAGTGTAL